MPRAKQTTPTIRRGWPMSLISAFFYPVSEAKVREVIEASREAGRSADELTRQAQVLLHKSEEEQQRPTVEPG